MENWWDWKKHQEKLEKHQKEEETVNRMYYEGEVKWGTYDCTIFHMN